MSRTAGAGERGAISLQGQEILASILGEDVAARVSGISRQAWDPPQEAGTNGDPPAADGR